ncbi:SRPBCC domain-containing protein [Cyanobacteria bacterium FACHB-502]|nr:SRPBCC domain-containing protein [Cyanobacteria bacterium FACHB-502]MBD2024168.1 SRPBCC domain-containing protein [Leptolyngbya sp. FACHB-711]
MFAAPRSLVFRVWTQPEHFARWLGPEDFRAIAC